MKRRVLVAVAAMLALAVLGIAGCTASNGSPSSSRPVARSAGAVPATSGATSPAIAAEQAVPPETSPPGDIPDNQAFVAFRTGGGVTVKVPEGWSRQETASSVTFTDKLNTVTLSWSAASQTPTEASFRGEDVPKLQQGLPAFELMSVDTVQLPAGAAVHAVYRVNGEANAVTGRRYRLEVEQYALVHNGTRVDLRLLSPVGSDNVDPWRIVSRSVTWN